MSISLKCTLLWQMLASGIGIVQDLRLDSFLDADQQRRLVELMPHWSAAAGVDTPLPTAEQTELDVLIEEEVRASAERTAALLHELTR
jgi:hypothetical protein